MVSYMKFCKSDRKHQFSLSISLSLVAVVGLEETFYRVSESVGVVEVCAIVYHPNITCPIQFPFNVNLSTIGNNSQSVFHLTMSVCCMIRT